MTIDYDRATDSLYIEFSGRKIADSLEVKPGFVLDLDAMGTVVGIDIEHASQGVDLRAVLTNVGSVPLA